jgi:hypothetical protein
MSYKKRKYFVALIPALLQYLSISYSTKHASELVLRKSPCSFWETALRLSYVNSFYSDPELNTVVADKALAGESYQVGQDNTSPTLIFPLMMTCACTLKPPPGSMRKRRDT